MLWSLESPLGVFVPCVALNYFTCHAEFISASVVFSSSKEQPLKVRASRRLQVQDDKFERIVLWEVKDYIK